MNSMYTNTMISQLADNEINITNRREMEPLLAKARQILTHYDMAMGTNTIILDRDGQVIKTRNYEKQAQSCEFCIKCFHNPSRLWQGNTCPCKNVHLAALEESRHSGKGKIYSCTVGFAYWTSPLYRNGQYSGALMTGQVLLCGRKAAEEKFRIHCKDNIATEKFKRVLEDIAEKSSEEIHAMAHLLDICARKISEKNDGLRKTIRRIVRREGELERVKTAIPENQIEKERALLAAFQRGDNKTGHTLIEELVNDINIKNSQNLELVRARAIELVVLLSRSVTISETSPFSAILKTNNRNLWRMLTSKTMKELTENLHLAAEQLAGEIFCLRGMRHASALRKAQRYIWKNLERKISLDEISSAAGLSAPYFSTIFREEMGENFSSYINRLRVEKAGILLTETGNSIKAIAKLCGFEDQSWFSKIFKKSTGITPGKYRETGSLKGTSYAP